jgi:hypothetical protein
MKEKILKAWEEADDLDLSAGYAMFEIACDFDALLTYCETRIKKTDHPFIEAMLSKYGLNGGV